MSSMDSGDAVPLIHTAKLKCEQRSVRAVKRFLVGLIVVLCGLNAGAEKPNIIFINVDDLGVMDVDYNSDRYLTPNLRRLCSVGMVYSEAYAAASESAPSRASVMSGQYPARHGIYTDASSGAGLSKDRKLVPIKSETFLPLENVTLAEALKKGGYKTVHLGKWNIGEDPTKQGFDVNIGGDASGSPKGGYFVPFTEGPMVEYNEDYEEGTHMVDVLTDQALKYMKIHEEEPFFMSLNFYSVHTPLVAVPWLVGQHDASVVNPKYASMVQMVDAGIGRILDAVYTLGLRNNTIIVFTSDNGGVKKISDQTPFRSGKGSYFDGGLRVPLVISWHGKTAKAGLCEVPVSGIDFYPTFLEIAGLKVPEGKVLDGVSLVPLFKKRGKIEDRPLFWHFPFYIESVNGKADDGYDEKFLTRPGTTVRMGRWKLHEYYEDGRIELYDLGADPIERMNFKHINVRTAERLHNALKEWREKIGAPIPTELNPEYVPSAK